MNKRLNVGKTGSAGASHCQAPAAISHCAGRQSGIGLLEVLIAVILLSVGFLAAGHMQIQGMRFSQDAYTLSQAKFMILDMTERMRVNRDALKGDAYKSLTTRAGTSNPACITNETPCTPADIATADLHAWSQNLFAPEDASDFTPLLPGSAAVPAKGTITYDAAEGAYSVGVQWSESLDGNDTPRSLSVKVFP